MNLLFQFVLTSLFPQDPGTRAWGEGQGQWLTGWGKVEERQQALLCIGLHLVPWG